MRRTAGAWLLAATAFVARGEIFDRIAASINNQVITESQVVEEIRVAAFLNDAEPEFSADTKKQALERLIEQELMRREMSFTRFPLPAQSDIQPLYNAIHGRFASGQAYESALKRYLIDDSDIRRHLQWQLMTLRFIEYRFQPGVQVSENEIRREYDRFAKDRIAAGAVAPPFDEIRPEMERIVRQRMVDSALDRWLGEARTQNDIIYRKGYEP